MTVHSTSHLFLQNDITVNEVTLGLLIVKSIPHCLYEFPPGALFIKWKSTFWALEEQPTLSMGAYVSSS